MADMAGRRSRKSSGNRGKKTTAAAPRPKPRVRRDPAAARELILTAAERVLAELGPDAASLPRIARAAGVSHALITHYFGTYDNLVEETFARRVTAMRAQVIAELAKSTTLSPADLLRPLAQTMMSQANMRLVAWALLSRRAEQSDFFAARMRGLSAVADVLEERWRSALGRRVPRAVIEFVLALVITALNGYAFGRTVVHAALGRPASPHSDADFLDRLADMLGSYVLAHSEPL
jgi:AcrR family transcriptional regulator